MRWALALLACFSFGAYAENAKPPAQAPKEERAPLNLKLDNPASWATVAPEPEKAPAEVLPTLGEGARPMPATPPGSRGSAFPSDANPGR